MKPEWGSRLCARAASCGSTMMRLPSGSVPPSGEAKRIAPERSEEHTSELQSLTNLVCRLLLEKKKKRSKEDSQKEILESNYLHSLTSKTKTPKPAPHATVDPQRTRPVQHSSTKIETTKHKSQH